MAAARDSVLDELARLKLTELPPKKIHPLPPINTGSKPPAYRSDHTVPYANTAIYANSVVGNSASPTWDEPPAYAIPQSRGRLTSQTGESPLHLPSRAQPQVPPNRPPPPPYHGEHNGTGNDRGVHSMYSATNPSRLRQPASYAEELNPSATPTPISSNYDGSHYQPPSETGSNYDSSSIYEPITPRPPSQLSAYSGASSSNYGAFYNRSSRGQPMGTLDSNDVTNRTDQASILSDLDYFDDLDETPVIGMCFKCGEKVLGEGSGCTAMDQIYHIACFTCHVCDKELRGKPFYAMDGKPYCEIDYLNTLEKCCVCKKPILDRILRATGKPYHPACFKCIVCGLCLDGIPFTIDASNQIYCIDDFHKKFAPRCCVCEEPIMPEKGQEETVRVVALDRSFHVKCYRCQDCGLLLSSESEGRGCYPLDDHILCRECNTTRVQVLTSPSNLTTEL